MKVKWKNEFWGEIRWIVTYNHDVVMLLNFILEDYIFIIFWDILLVIKCCSIDKYDPNMIINVIWFAPNSVYLGIQNECFEIVDSVLCEK